jgi:hypothetical protein
VSRHPSRRQAMGGRPSKRAWPLSRRSPKPAIFPLAAGRRSNRSDRRACTGLDRRIMWNPWPQHPSKRTRQSATGASAMGQKQPWPRVHVSVPRRLRLQYRLSGWMIPVEQPKGDFMRPTTNLPPINSAACASTASSNACPKASATGSPTSDGAPHCSSRLRQCRRATHQVDQPCQARRINLTHLHKET